MTASSSTSTRGNEDGLGLVADPFGEGASRVEPLGDSVSASCINSHELWSGNECSPPCGLSITLVNQKRPDVNSRIHSRLELLLNEFTQTAARRAVEAAANSHFPIAEMVQQRIKKRFGKLNGVARLAWPNLSASSDCAGGPKCFSHHHSDQPRAVGSRFGRCRSYGTRYRQFFKFRFRDTDAVPDRAARNLPCSTRAIICAGSSLRCCAVSSGVK
jgi:hypothetical protein